MGGIHLLWYKRDLRVRDHAALAQAAAQGTVLPLYVIEPELWRQPDYSARHWQWLRASLLSLADELHLLDATLCVQQGGICAVLERIHRELPIAAVHSHVEVGNAWTYARDRRVAAWLREKGIPWWEYPQDGIARPHPDRDHWQRQRDRYMAAPIISLPAHLTAVATLPSASVPLAQLPESEDLALTDALLQDHLPTSGPEAADQLVDGFLSEKYRHYLGGMSSPVSAAQSCSRLSPYLALGVCSARQVVQQISAAQRQEPHRGLRALQSRLAWRGHFMQKLEDEPRMERENLQRALSGLRESEFNESHFQAWQRGETGFPLVDACMRYLQAGGWLNFRMRAMLVSFSAYALWLHWQRPALHLARLFVDYEPGIHYPQVQMQSGTTGINALRIYNVTKQAQELDPQGIFLRRWLPELAPLSPPWIHQPWLLPQQTAKRLGVCLDRDYPAPIVSLTAATRQARARILTARRELDARTEAEQILRRHGSRKHAGGRVRRHTREERQLSLFVEGEQ